MPHSHNEIRFETNLTQADDTQPIPCTFALSTSRGIRPLSLTSKLALLPATLLLCLLLLVFFQLLLAFPDKAVSLALVFSVAGIAGFLLVTKQVNSWLLPVSQLIELLDKKESIEDALRTTENQLNNKNQELQDSRTHFLEMRAKVLKLQSKLEDLQRGDNPPPTPSTPHNPILAVVSHEIRTPLHGIIGCCSLMRDTCLTPEQEDLCAIVDDSGHQLMRLFDDILEVSRLESGKTVIEPKMFHLKTFLEEITAVFRHQTKLKSIDLCFEMSGCIPPRMVSDPAKLRHILFNLIGNAVKFTEQGMVKVEVRPIPGSNCENGCWLEWSVSDTGIGIREEDLGRLFRPFNRVDHSDSRKHPGVGLGLCIAQRLCHLMGGEIEVQSTPGKGTRFTFQLFFEKAL